MSDGGAGTTVQRENDCTKPYEQPILRKGPLLSRTTAVATISGGTTGNESDIRLKRDFHALTRLENGLTLYRFRYLWSDVEMVGVMAQDVLKIAPDAVMMGTDGYYRVDYGRLGLRLVTYAEWLTQRPLASAA